MVHGAQFCPSPCSALNFVSSSAAGIVHLIFKKVDFLSLKKGQKLC
jgi:hypothetical protein